METSELRAHLFVLCSEEAEPGGPIEEKPRAVTDDSKVGMLIDADSITRAFVDNNTNSNKSTKNLKKK